MTRAATAAAKLHVGGKYQLPGEATAFDGTKYDPRQDQWAISTLTTTYHFDFADSRMRGLPPALLISFKGCVMARLKAHTAHSANTLFTTLLVFFRYVAAHHPGANPLTMAHLASFRSSLSKKDLPRSTSVNNAIRFWASLGLPGVTDDALAYAVDAEKSHHITGRAVRTRCPISGPYSSLEYDGLYKALHAAFAAGTVEFDNYVLCLLSGALGPRSGQLALLKVCDLTISRRADGSNKYVLSVPRLKQRGQIGRSEFKDRELIEEIGMLLELHVTWIRADARAAGFDPTQMALFPKSQYDERVLEPTEHNSPSGILKRIDRVFIRLNVISERTGRAIKVTPARQRRTLGTRAAQEGKPPAVIADLLDHSDTRNIMVYVEARMDMLRRLDQKMALYMAPLAQRFAGQVVRRGRDAENGITRHVLGVIQEGEASEDIGGCGKHTVCGLPKPVACYTCVKFQAWDDGPHEAVLNCMLSRRQRQAEQGSLRVAESLDDTVLAVAWVVHQCRDKKAALQGGPNG